MLMQIKGAGLSYLMISVENRSTAFIVVPPSRSQWCFQCQQYHFQTKFWTLISLLPLLSYPFPLGSSTEANTAYMHMKPVALLCH